jgi:hypothetical protein
MKLLLCTVVILASAVAGCGSKPAPITSAQTAGCTAGTSLACTCSNGSPGTGLCSADQRVGPCSCAAAGPASPALAGAGASAAVIPASSGAAGASAALPAVPSTPLPMNATLPAAASVMTVAGSSASAHAGAAASSNAGASAGPAAPAGSAAPAAVAGHCPGTEMCQVSMIGGFKFCAPMTQSLPPPCTTANQPCGSDTKGTCFDAAAVGFAGMLYCLYLSCS